MKHLLILFSSCLFLNTTSFSQNKGDIKFSVFGGPSYAGTMGDDFKDLKEDLDELADNSEISEGSSFVRGRLGFHLGAKGEYFLNDYISLGIAPSYTQKGYSAEADLTYDSGDELKSSLNVRLDYLELPVIATYYMDNGFHILAGFSSNMLISDEVEQEDESNINGTESSTDTKGSYEKITDEELEESITGLLIGVGMKIDFGYINLKFHNTSPWQKSGDDYANFSTSLSLGVDF